MRPWRSFLLCVALPSWRDSRSSRIGCRPVELQRQVAALPGMGRNMKTVFRLAAFAMLFAACQTMADVKPGDGHRATIDKRSYDDIWKAATRVAEEHFEIRESDRERGTILAERPNGFVEPGAWVGIFISPASTGAPTYTVEVVRRKKMTTNVGVKDWEQKVIRDIFFVLNNPGKPLP